MVKIFPYLLGLYLFSTPLTEAGEIGKQEAKIYFLRAENYKTQRLYGNAVVELLRAKENPELREIIEAELGLAKERLQQEYSQLLEKTNVGVSLQKFKSEDNPKLGKFIDNYLIELFLKSKNIRIVKRGGDLSVTGEVLSADMDINTKKLAKSVKYKKGEREIQNPEYLEMEKELTHAQQEKLLSEYNEKEIDQKSFFSGISGLLLKDKRMIAAGLIGGALSNKVSGADSAREEYDTIKENLESISPTIKQDLHGLYTYEELHSTLISKITFVLQFIKDEEILYHSTLSEKVEYKDIYRPEFKEAEIYGDPFELPHPIDVEEELIIKTLERLRDSLDNGFRDYLTKTFLSNARAYRISNKTMALEEYLKFNYASKEPAEEELNEIKDFVLKNFSVKFKDLI